MTPLFAFVLSPLHILVVLGLGILIFGRRMPELGRSLGKGIVEFKKGLKGLEDEVEGSLTAAPPESAKKELPRPPERVSAPAPRFDDHA